MQNNVNDKAKSEAEPYRIGTLNVFFLNILLVEGENGLY